MKLIDPKLFQPFAYVGGEWTAATSNSTYEVHNPATGELLGTVPNMGAIETQEAIKSISDDDCVLNL